MAVSAIMHPFPDMRRALSAWALLTLLAMLGGCATQPGQPPGNTRNLDELNRWRLDGKLGFRSPEKNGSAWVRWSQDRKTYDLQLNGPFGAAATEIRGDENYAVLSQSGEEDLTAPDGETLSAQLFGWPFPVREMAHWVKGQPAPGTVTTISRDGQGLLKHLDQSGWSLTFSDYTAAGSWTLPGRIRGRRGDLGFTLVIKQWHPGGRSPE